MEDINNTFIPKDVSEFTVETDDFSVSCISKVSVTIFVRY